MRVEKLEFQREFLKLATQLNKLINEEIRLGEEQEDMQVNYYLQRDISYTKSI